MCKDKKSPSKVAFFFSAVALTLAALVSVFNLNLWLAGTQWILVAIILAIYATYFNGCDCDCCKKEE